MQLEEYYPYAAEFTLLKENSDRIASIILPESIIVELGCGTAAKSACLLNALQATHGRCQYVGIDVSGTALNQACGNLLRQVQGLIPRNLHFVEDEYLEGLKQVRHRFPNEILSILWLGSSIGNLSEDQAISFMREVLKIVGSRCQFFLCADMWKDEITLHRAYCDEKGVTERFIKNGMRNALGLLGHVVTKEEENSWIYDVHVNHKLRRVEMWLIFPNGLHIDEHSVRIRPGERVLVEFSRKFRVEDVQELATMSNFYIHEAWRNHLYGSQMLHSWLEALLCCWRDTDALFQRIPDWSAKPIDLRHPFCFYYGHMSAFTKLKLLPREQVSELDVLFSRGIDPCVLVPTKCHKHPEVPTHWPSSDRLYAYVNGIRSSVMKSGGFPMRLVCFVLEHERMHQETLAYMLAQLTKSAFERDFKASTQVNSENPEGTQHNSVEPMIARWPNYTKVYIPSGKVQLGCKATDGMFVWDNETPICESEVAQPFLVSSKPVSIKQYLEFIRDGGYDREELWDFEDFSYFKHKGYKHPATWSMMGEDCYVHGQWETRNFTEAANEAVYVSLSEAEAYCKWAGGCRVMSEEEYQRILDYLMESSTKDHTTEIVESMQEAGWEWTSSNFKPYPGFLAMAEYPEYSADFFDGKHFVLKGSSPATHPALRRSTFRNFYQRQYRYVFAKFRCCKSVSAAASH